MEHPFEVGGTYANRHGSYEVVWIDETGGVMGVRFLSSGEEQELGIALQTRIWNNMQLEQQESIRRAAEEDSRYQRGYGNAFTGLKEHDFKTMTEGTTWRSRSGLAGLVALRASEGTPYTFVSWAVYRWPVAFLTHREDYEMAAFEMGSRKAKFTLEVDDHFLYYGFYVEKFDQPMCHEWDWLRLMQRLKTEGHLRRIIQSTEADHNARLIGRRSTGQERFHFANGLAMGAESLWDEKQATRLSVEERIEMLETAPDDYWGEIYIISQLSKQQAIEAGSGVVDPIARLFGALLPVYRAAVAP